MSKFKIVLHSPEIPGNTGSIGRTCLALDIELILIHPLGFDLSEKAVRRAGLDYWKYVKIKEYKSWEEFLALEKPNQNALFFFSKNGPSNYYQAKFKEGSYLVFGSETKGLPESFLQNFPKQFYSLPMYSNHIRSLNLANTVTAASYECLRQLCYDN